MAQAEHSDTVGGGLSRQVMRAERADLRIALVSGLALLAFWALIAFVLADPRRAPGPWLVLPLMAEGLWGGKLLGDLGATLGRVALSFSIAMAVGVAGGVALGMSKRADRIFGTWLTVALNVPALVTIVLCYLWVGLNEWAAVIAEALNKIPMVMVMLREGARVLDPQLAAMGRVYSMGPSARLRHIILPQLAPHILSAARAGLAMIWKIVLVVEFLGRSNGIGFRIHMDFQMFNIAGVLANAFAFIAVMLVIEAGVLAPLARRASRWRQG